MKNTDSEFEELLADLNKKPIIAHTSTHSGWDQWRGLNQGGKNRSDIARLELLHDGHDSEAWRIWWDYPDDSMNKCVVILSKRKPPMHEAIEIAELFKEWLKNAAMERGNDPSEWATFVRVCAFLDKHK